MTKDIPHFIKIRGCINCNSSKDYKKKYNTDYGFDHEIVAGCVIRGCFNYGYTLLNPFIDPEELVQRVKDSNNISHKENIKKYCLEIKGNFEKFYDIIGVSIDDLINQL